MGASEARRRNMEIKASEYDFEVGEYIVFRLEIYKSHQPCKPSAEATILGRVLMVTPGYAYVLNEQVLYGEYSPALIKLSRHAKYERAYIIMEDKKNVQ